MRTGLAALASVCAFAALAANPVTAAGEPRPVQAVPLDLSCVAWPTSHVQGVVVDREAGYVYYSFTTMLVKADLQGKVVGTVGGLTGHLGDLDQNSDDGRIYGSLEYKDAQSFYIAIFHSDKIDRVGMDAKRDDVMTTVYLREVVEDFTADMDHNGVFDGDVAATPDHRYGSSGIDGVSFGPEFGKRNPDNKLLVAYGIYTNLDRSDNNYQVLLEYDVRLWARYERPLSPTAPHRSGPRATPDKFFVYTGNTHFGVQNLEYDSYTGNWMMAVYKGQKSEFPNYSLFMVDGDAKPRRGVIEGQPRKERGKVLPLLQYGLYDPATGIHGWESEGNYGLESLGDGTYYIAKGAVESENGVKMQGASLTLNYWTGETPTPFRIRLYSGKAKSELNDELSTKATDRALCGVLGKAPHGGMGTGIGGAAGGPNTALIVLGGGALLAAAGSGVLTARRARTQA